MGGRGEGVIDKYRSTKRTHSRDYEMSQFHFTHIGYNDFSLLHTHWSLSSTRGHSHDVKDMPGMWKLRCCRPMNCTLTEVNSKVA